MGLLGNRFENSGVGFGPWSYLLSLVLGLSVFLDSTLFGSIRAVLFFLAYDLVLVLWLRLVPGVGSHLSFFPWLSLIGMVGVLVESGRVPGDLSELVSDFDF